MEQKVRKSHISVCMATFNGHKNIREQLDSILMQISDNDEIIISDDGSTDGTLEVINSYRDPRIKLKINGARLGIVRNFERAIACASGTIIFLSDQDDIWRADKVEAVCNVFDSTHAIAVVSDARIVDADRRILMDSFFLWRGSAPGFWWNIYKNGFLGCTMAFRADIKGVLLPFPPQISMHDEWIGLCCSLTGQVLFLNEALIDYRRHQANHTRMSRGVLRFGLKKRFKNLYSIFIRVPAILKWRRSHSGVTRVSL